MLKVFFSEPDEISGFLDTSQSSLSEIADRFDDIYWTIEKEGITLSVEGNIRQVTEDLRSKLSELFSTEEDIIYRELEKVLPGQSSVSAIKSDNENILIMCDSLCELVEKGDLKKEKDMLQSLIIAIIDLIRRNVHKKTGILYHEVQTLLPVEMINEMIEKIKLHRGNGKT